MSSRLVGVRPIGTRRVAWAAIHRAQDDNGPLDGCRFFLVCLYAMNDYDPNHSQHIFLFHFPWPGPVHLVGDFNRWRIASGFQMHDTGDRWELRISLPSGQHRYGYEVRGCIFEDPEVSYLRRSQGWPRSCAVCPVRHECNHPSTYGNTAKTHDSICQ